MKNGTDCVLEIENWRKHPSDLVDCGVVEGESILHEVLLLQAEKLKVRKDNFNNKNTHRSCKSIQYVLRCEEISPVSCSQHFKVLSSQEIGIHSFMGSDNG